MKKHRPKREADRDEKGSHRDLVGEKTRSPANNPVLDLQRTIGNRAVNELLGSGSPEKLRVGQPGEPEEVEADRAGQEVAGGANAETGHAQAKTAEPAGASGSAAVEPAVNLGPGQEMDATVRASMEAHFGHDFSDVRIHNDSRAAESARAVSARAYTLGKDVVFDSGEYAPEKKEGKQLLAHELTHVIQQGAARPGSSAAKGISRSGPQGSAGKVLQRQPAPSSTPAPSAPPTTTAAPPATAPQLTQAFYDQAIAILTKLPGANATLVAILKQGKVGQRVGGVKIVLGPQPATSTALPGEITFDLEISPTTANLPLSAAAQFVEDPKNQTNIQADPAKGVVVTRLLQIIAKPAASANDMAWSLLHEGIHMLLGIDRTVDFIAGTAPGVASGSTGTLKSLAQYQQASKTSAKRAGLVSALVSEINRVKSLSAPPPSVPAPSGKPPASPPPGAPAPASAPAAGPSANDIVDDVIDEILEERFAFDQQVKQFPGSRTVTNSLLADAYMFDQLAFGLGLNSWPTPPNRAALVTLMAAFLDDVELILNPPAPAKPGTKPSPSATPPKKP